MSALAELIIFEGREGQQIAICEMTALTADAKVRACTGARFCHVQFQCELHGPYCHVLQVQEFTLRAPGPDHSQINYFVGKFAGVRRQPSMYPMSC